MLNFDTLLEQTGIIAILRNIPEQSITSVMDALYDGGVRLAEITFDSTEKVTPEQTAACIQKASEYMTDKMLIGAGTVTTKKQLKAAKAGGSRFIISPNTEKAWTHFPARRYDHFRNSSGKLGGRGLR